MVISIERKDFGIPHTYPQPANVWDVWSPNSAIADNNWGIFNYLFRNKTLRDPVTGFLAPEKGVKVVESPKPHGIARFSCGAADVGHQEGIF